MKINMVITRPVYKMIVVTAICLVAFGIITIAVPWQASNGEVVGKDLEHYSMPWTNNSPFYPSEWKTEDDKLVNWRGVPSATFCAECHEKEYKEWASSIHAITGPDVIYENAISVNELASKHGGDLATEKVRWCDGCHEPLGILAGEGTPVPQVGPNEALEEGTTCIVCHTATEARPLIGNGGLTLDINEINRYMSPAMILAAPEEHARGMQAKKHNPLLGQSEFCGSCHTEIRPTRINGDFPLHFQETFDEWRLSAYAENNIQCQDCHMTDDPAGYVRALKNGEKPKKVVSHRFVGNNYLLTDNTLPEHVLVALRGGWVPGHNVFLSSKEWIDDLGKQNSMIKALLREAADVKINTRQAIAGEQTQLDVVITNSGAGHNLPTGPLDQRHMWVELIVKDADDNVIYHNGWFNDKTGEIDPDVVALYLKQLWDDDDKLIKRHILFDVKRMNYLRKPILAKESDTISYQFNVPANVKGPLKVESKLWYRLALQEILENVKEFQFPPIPALEGFIIPPVLMVENKANITISQQTAGTESEKKEQTNVN